MRSNKIIIVGIDGGELTVIKEMIRRHLMPNMEQIIQQSYVNQMDCYIQGPGQGWASFMTGKSPVKHGMFFWKTYLGASSSDVDDEKIWDVLGKNGVTSGVINLSYTFPPERIKGFMISGLGGGMFATNDIVYSYPENLIGELETQANGYIWGVKRVLGGAPAQSEYLQKVINMTEKRGEACLYLLKKYDPDFFLVVFRGADAIQHSFWHFLDSRYSISDDYRDLIPLINKYYNLLDSYIGKIWEQNDNAYKFIISDHGFGPTKSILYINEYLAQKGLLVKKRDIKSQVGNVHFMKIKTIFDPFYEKYFARYKIFENLNKLRKRKMDKIQVAIDWQQSSVYARCPYGICFNRKVADTSEKQNAIFQDVKPRLLSLRNPETSSPVFKNVYRKEVLDIKKHQDAAPDIIFETADESYCILPDIFVDQDRHVFKPLDTIDIGKINGSHRRYGLLIAAGKHMDRVHGLSNLSIIDVYATILKILNVPIPEDTDGQPFLQ